MSEAVRNYVREYYREELEAGETEARKKEQFEQITKMLTKGKSPEEIMEFCDYPFELILEVQNTISQPA